MSKLYTFAKLGQTTDPAVIIYKLPYFHFIIILVQVLTKGLISCKTFHGLILRIRWAPKAETMMVDFHCHRLKPQPGELPGEFIPYP